MMAAARRACDRGATDGVAATDDRDRRSAGAHRGLVRRAIDPECEARHDRRVGRDQRRGDPAGGGPSGRRRATGPDDRHRPVARQGRRFTRDEQDVRRHGHRGEAKRVRGLLDRDHPEAECAHARHAARSTARRPRRSNGRRLRGSGAGRAGPVASRASPSAVRSPTDRRRPRGSPDRSRTAPAGRRSRSGPGRGRRSGRSTHRAPSHTDPRPGPAAGVGEGRDGGSS